MNLWASNVLALRQLANAASARGVAEWLFSGTSPGLAISARSGNLAVTPTGRLKMRAAEHTLVAVTAASTCSAAMPVLVAPALATLAAVSPRLTSRLAALSPYLD